MHASSFILLLGLLSPLTSALPVTETETSVLDSAKALKEYPVSVPGPETEPEKVVKRQGGSYWYETAEHGISAFGASGYAVFRNVKDYGAVGDGVTDDTDAINRAASDGNRCGQECGSSTTLPAVVYFPGGTYLVSRPIVQLYNTQFVGNPNDRPTLRASADFSGIGVIDSNIYIPGGKLKSTTALINLSFQSNVRAASGAQWYIPQSNFYRQVRNFVVDISGCPNSTPDGFGKTLPQFTVSDLALTSLLPPLASTGRSPRLPVCRT
jgi:hypothetical protein